MASMVDESEKPVEPRQRAARRVKAPAPPKVVLGPGDWIAAALELLVTDNIDAIRVDVLAKRIGVTRGSFYWHFADREDLLTRLLDHWRNTTTEGVIARFNREGIEPAEMLRSLLNLPYHGKTAAQASSIEMALREWSRRDETARMILTEVDNQRLGYIAQCFSAMGCNITQARLRAAVLYSQMISESLLHHVLPASQNPERLAFLGAALIDDIQSERGSGQAITRVASEA
jgi:AcrR family transcriptional regulator